MPDKNFNQMKYFIGALSLILFMALTAVGYVKVQERIQKFPKPYVSKTNKECIDCHVKKGVAEGGILDWKHSRHAAKGIGCIECHQAAKTDPDAYEHEGFTVATIVSPKDCSQCHEKEAKEFQQSHHAKAAEFVGSLDNFLGNIIEGPPAAQGGCNGCHGSQVKVLANGKLDAATWPNTGMGRINPDGSKGACSACHARHKFSKAQARQPEECGRCHLGPDHPQLEAYYESKHGILFRANIESMNLDNPKERWRPGKDYLYPTCATCHMSATVTQDVTHDVGKRISWNLRAPVSKKMKNWEQKRKAMQDVCHSCHGPEHVDNFYQLLDDGVSLYNNKFAIPAKTTMKKLKASGKITATPFDEKIEWVWWELWHHEGRRARHGLSKGAPDYIHWNGFYDVAKNFYTKFIPELKKLDPKLAKELLAKPEHQWLKGLSKEERAKTIEYYKKRYGKE